MTRRTTGQWQPVATAQGQQDDLQLNWSHREERESELGSSEWKDARTTAVTNCADLEGTINRPHHPFPLNVVLS